ncbi:unnamed protein product [Strongylus vulgaris]|uniref:G-protein coupled receptors family 2 profile 2 domain-containing protein n=1 Tax=Strongylus vulgaris TaxID=40348 RepID=A0A3P7IE82_STRVU|nr:unnamed protein product [Strongylus vulgaris]
MFTAAPFLTTLLLAIKSNFFERGDCFCWVRPDYVVYAVVLPTSLLVLNAIFCTIVICMRLFCNGKFSKAVRQHQTRVTSKIGAVLVMQLSIGMPWVLQYFTIYSPYATIWHYIFTTVMGSQGTLLALLFYYKRRKSTSFYRASHMGHTTKEESSMDSD